MLMGEVSPAPPDEEGRHKGKMGEGKGREVKGKGGERQEMSYGKCSKLRYNKFVTGRCHMTSVAHTDLTVDDIELGSRELTGIHTVHLNTAHVHVETAVKP